MLTGFLTQLFGANSAGAIKILEKSAAEHGLTDDVRSMTRLAIFRPHLTAMSYMSLQNIWTRLGKPTLKPNPVDQKIAILSNLTVDTIAPPLTMFCAAYGVNADVAVAGFDSVEQTVFDPTSMIYTDRPDIVVIMLSDHWLRRHTGDGAMVAESDIRRAEEALETMVLMLEKRTDAKILLGNVPLGAYPTEGGAASFGEMMGWNLAVTHFNARLAKLTSTRTHIVNVTEAIFAAGGRKAMGAASYFRGRMAFEPVGNIAVAREIASAVAGVCGKTHRALVTDWDNTIWGGEVAETGSHGVICGQDSPDALAYTMIQSRMKSLKSFGVLLAGVSRNDPAVAKIFDENPEMVLKQDDFASLHISWHPKSDAVTRISQELGFGAEFFVFVDDSLFEVAEVLKAHPHIDVIVAGQEPQTTLDRLYETRFFNAISVSQEDMDRGGRALALKRQREVSASYADIGEFLKKINIRLRMDSLHDDNIRRVAQMFQKTNQFNLTTRRHGETELLRMKDSGADIVVISYEDAFGSQGIISVIVLIPDGADVKIESWLMSCRVLNRTVEHAALSHIREMYMGKRLAGEYIPTQKNGLVKDLYKNFGFAPGESDEATGAQMWYKDSFGDEIKHFAQIIVKE